MEGEGMKRRQFLQVTGASAAGLVGAYLLGGGQAAWGANAPRSMDAAAFQAARRFVALPFGKIAYVEQGAGDVALFLHGAPLNGFQWRGVIPRLSPYRRCIALDFMGLGYSEVPASQALNADAQVAMVAALLDALAIGKVDIVASDSGTAVAQLLAIQHAPRVRSLLLTNGDVEPDSPPAGVKPAIDMARAGTLADATAKWLTDKALARSTFGAAVYKDPRTLTDEAIAYYVTPLVSSPLRRSQYHAFHLALESNPLAGTETALKHCSQPARIVWGAGDTIFLQSDADYLDRTLPGSRGIRRIPGGKLFFQEEFPDVIAEEARRLWGVG
jgi:pimeloyl-ACP methyl ester carboxylesterase